jgi:hypothetical protein
MVLANKSITGEEAPKVRYSNQGWFWQYVRLLRRHFLQDGDLPFSNVLPKELVAHQLAAIGQRCPLLPLHPNRLDGNRSSNAPSFDGSVHDWNAGYTPIIKSRLRFSVRQVLRQKGFN